MRDPDKRSDVCCAWRIDPSPTLVERYMKDFGYPPLGIGPTWVIHSPHYHPFWAFWYSALVVLDEIPGAPKPHRQYPEAKYELLVVSLHPEGGEAGALVRPSVPDIEKIEAGDIVGGLPSFLEPPDVVYQFHGVDDEQAIAIHETMIDAIVSGYSCDSDMRDWWRRSLDATVEHYELGMHG